MTLDEYLAEHGAATRVAREIGITHSAVLQWKEKGVPAERVLDVERITGISRHELRPDVFGPSPSQSQAAA
jgi:DNA-binding transcriptional regulator YdaS (Cro superfamily)